MRRLLALLLSAVVVFGGAGAADAAPVFPDIGGCAAQKDIISLYALGIIGGYPDGTFRPDGSITRAEFAKVVVLSLGKGGSADLLRNTATQFSDVPAGQWFSGLINVAVANGICKGYADGTFRPSAPISQAEATTMLLRAMGYNDNLPGAWPLSYVMVAADLGIIGDGFAADRPASRAFVADVAMAVLGHGRVTYDPTNRAFSEPTATPLLSALAAATWVADALVTGYSASSDVLAFAGEPAYSLPLAAGASVATGEARSDLTDKRVSYIKHTTAGVTEIIYIEIKTPVVTGTVAAIDAVGGTVTLTNGTTIRLATGCTILKNGVMATIIDVSGSDVTALLDRDGKAYRLVAAKLDVAGKLTGKTTIVRDGVTTCAIVLDNLPATRAFTVPSTATVVRNGAVAAFADLKVNDDILMSVNGTAAVTIDALAQTKEAVVTSYARDAAGALLSVSFADATTIGVKNGVAPFALTVGWRTEFALNRVGEIIAKLSDSPVATVVCGRITAVGQTVSVDGTAAHVTLDSGVTYAVTATAATAGTHLNLDDAAFAALKPEQVVQLSLNGAGEVQRIDAYTNGWLPDGYWDLLGHGNLAPGAVVTLNSAPADIDDVWDAGDYADVAWDPTTGLFTSVRAYDFTSERLTVVGTTITTEVDGTVRYSILIPSGTIALPAGFAIEKDGAAGSFAVVAVGDKLDVGPLGGAGNRFVRLTADASFHADDALTGTVDITVAAAASTIHIHFADVVQSYQITIDGVPLVNPPLSANRREATVAAEPGARVVGIMAIDYAGNAAGISITVTVPR